VDARQRGGALVDFDEGPDRLLDLFPLEIRAELVERDRLIVGDLEGPLGLCADADAGIRLDLREFVVRRRCFRLGGFRLGGELVGLILLFRGGIGALRRVCGGAELLLFRAELRRLGLGLAASLG